MLNYLMNFILNILKFIAGGGITAATSRQSPPVIPQTLSNLSIAASSRCRENDLFQSFGQSPGSIQSCGSSPKELFDNHFQVENMEDKLLNKMLQDSPAEDDVVTGSAANLSPEPEPEKTPEPERPEDEGQDEPVEREGDIEDQEINTPTRRQGIQETGEERGMTGEINTPSPEKNSSSKTCR